MADKFVITMDGKYENNYGPVRVLCVDAPGECPVVFIEPNSSVLTCSINGMVASSGNKHDLREVKALDVDAEDVTVWVNFYPDRDVVPYRTKDAAKMCASYDLIRTAAFKEVKAKKKKRGKKVVTWGAIWPDGRAVAFCSKRHEVVEHCGLMALGDFDGPVCVKLTGRLPGKTKGEAEQDLLDIEAMEAE